MSLNSKCVGPMKATVLSCENPGEISVRLALFDEPFAVLKDKINDFYSKNAPDLQIDPATSLRFGDTVAVFNNSCWCRAQIIGIQKGTFTLLLLDYAQKVDNVILSRLHKLADVFLRPNAYAFFCHLPRVSSTSGPTWHSALTDEVKRLVEEFGPDVQVRPLGPVQMSTDVAGCSVRSLPVEVNWTYEEPDNPLAPNKTKQIYLSAKLNRIHFAVTGEKEVDDDDLEPYEDNDVLAYAAELDNIPASAAELANNSIMSEDTQDSEEGEECELKEVVERKKFHWLDPEIPCELQFMARCTHVDESGQIYLHLYENRSTMRIIRELLRDKFRKVGTSDKEKFKEKLEEGQECVARFRDGNWYRGRVLEASDDVTNVLFVDYGNVSAVKNKYIRSSLYCKENPIQAIRVVLGNVKPWTGNDDWSEGSLDFMQEKLHYDHPEGNRVVLVKVIGSNDSLPLQVTIELPPTSTNGVWIDLGDLLVQIGEAVPMDGFLPSQELLLNWEKLSYGIGAVAAGTYKIKTEEIENPKANPVFCEKMFPALELKDVSEGDIIDFQLVEALSHNTILVYPTIGKSESELSRLANQYIKMLKVLQINADRMPPIIQPTDGLPVAARYPGEKIGWYRGVIQQHSASKVLVQYVDYGPQTSWIDTDQVKALPEECLSVPVAGLELVLSDFTAYQDVDDEHLGTSKMMEVLFNMGTRVNEETILKVRISKVKPKLTGLVINCKQPFQVLELDDISEGDIIDLKLIEVLSYNKILTYPINNNSGSQLSRLADQYIKMMKLLQAEADKMPPITHVVDGLPVAASFSMSDSARNPKMGWFRGVIVQHSVDKFQVKFVDYGPQTYWLDNDQVKELPKQCLSVPVTVLELILPVDPVSKEEDDVDLASAMMMEKLYSLETTLNDDTVIKVKISKVKPQLTGHIVDENEKPVYWRLVKEGLISFKEIHQTDALENDSSELTKAAMANTGNKNTFVDNLIQAKSTNNYVQRHKSGEEQEVEKEGTLSLSSNASLLHSNASLLCSICKELCKRGVATPCCNAKACRYCAVKNLNDFVSNVARKCWNCGHSPLATQQLITDQDLRDDVQRFIVDEIGRKYRRHIF